RTRYTMTRTLLPSMDGTIGAPDEPVSDADTAVVTLSNPLDSLNLRSQANTSSAILAQMPHGTQVTLLEYGSAWSRVQYGTLSGYVKNEYLSIMDDGVEEAPPVSASKGTATVALSDESQTLNLRAAPTTGSAIVSRLRHGTVLTVLERYESWTFVAHGALSGYVMNDYIVYDAEGSAQPEAAPAPQPPAQGESLTATVALQSSDSRLNLRADKSLSAAVLLRLTPGIQVKVTQWGEEWCAVSYGGVTGYCSTDYLQFEQTNENEQIVTPSVKTAIVLPSDGLNLRMAASLSSGVVMTLPQGAMLTVTGEESGGMLPVRLGSIAGYVSAQYVYVTEQAIVQQATPAPTPTPQPTEQPVLGSAMVTASSGLVLRSGPDAQSDRLTTMPYGAMVSITGEQTGGFYPVRYGQMEGYASASYLALAQSATPIPIPTATPTPQPTAQPVQQEGRMAHVTAVNGLNLRAQPSASAPLVATLGYGVQVQVRGEQVNGFYPVRVGTLAGYVSADYIGFDAQYAPQQPAPTATPLVQRITPAPQAEEAYRVVVDSDNGLNLRAQPNGTSEVLYVLPYGMVLTVLGEGENGFLHVTWANYEGYVSGDYVTPLGQ
ncbi:MAG: SH3 domain-containing protein, partial [Clostridia bacterium]|nr:SH3 domain-containing protein [Clostridia bacterium]